MKLPRHVERKCLKLAGRAGEPAPDLVPLLAAVRAAGFADPVPEVAFAPPRRWRFDLAWPALLVAFEREGGDRRQVRCPGCGRTKTAFVSRHHSRDGLERDIEKYTRAMLSGWLVVRATPPMLADGRAAAALVEALTLGTRGGR